MSSENSSQEPLTVVGGTYLERTLFPDSYNFYGSGLRAAAAVANRGLPVSFHTFIGDTHLQSLLATAKIFGLDLHICPFPVTFQFDYLHTLAAPIVCLYTGQNATSPIQVTGNRVLCFGMMEGNPVILGDRVVYDPQSPNAPFAFSSNGSSARELAILCNQHEARLLAGVEDLDEAGPLLLQQPNARIVVIKNGARGAIVFDGSKVSHLPAYRCRATSLVGSGDVFSAEFAYRWLVAGDDPVESADAASRSVAYYCATQVLPVPHRLPSTFPQIPATTDQSSRKVYLAGPFFTLQELWMVNETRRCLEQQGLEVFSPYHEIGLGLPEVVAKRDLAELESCDFVFALLDGRDAGTIFEVGYARAVMKPVIILCTSENNEYLTMFVGSGCEVHNNFVAAIYAAAWMR